MNPHQWFVAVLATLSVTAAPAAHSVPLATGPGGLQVTSEDVTEDVNLRVPPDVRPTILKNAGNVATLSRTLALRRTLATQAEEQKLDKDPQIAYQIRVARERILADARAQQLEGAAPDPAVIEKLAQSEYRAKPGSYAIPEKVRARHILIDARSCDAQKRIEELLAQANAPGANFAKLAADNSQDEGSAKRGGDLGFFERGQMDPEFEKAAFALQKPGDISGIVRSKFGLHIIKLEERTPAGREPFEKVRSSIMQDMAARESARRRSEAIEAISGRIQIDESAVSAFVQSGR